MSSNKTPNSHNILIAEYTLGLLDRHDMARAHQLLSHDDSAVTTALNWENSLLELTDLLPPVDPSPLLLQRIQATLGHDAVPTASSLYRQPASLRPKESEPADSSVASNALRTTPTERPAPERPTTPAAGSRPVVTEMPRPAQPPALAPSPAASTAAPATHTASKAPAAAPPSGNASGPGAVITPLTRPSTAGAAPSAPGPAPVASHPVRSRPAQSNAAAATPSPTSSPTQLRHDSARGASSTPAAAAGMANRPHTVEHTLGDGGSAGSPPRTTAPAAPLPEAIPITQPSSLPPAQSRRLSSSVWIWRGTTLVFAALALALALMPSEPVKPPVTVVKVAPTRAAILQAPGQSSTPAWIVTFDPQGNVLMSPQVRSDIPADAAVQLWTYNATLPQPRSMGLIDPNKPITVPATLMGELGKEQYFEMTLEPHGGSPTSSPSGPVLFIGRVVTFGAPEAADTSPQGASSQNTTQAGS